MISWAVFVSGSGSNLQNFIELEKSQLKHNRIQIVVSDKDCPALERARKAEKVTYRFDPKASDAYANLLKKLEAEKVDAIFLLGFMRILPADFLKAWKPRLIVNLHPSLLPKYKGKDAVQQAIDAKDDHIGISLHEVVEEVDGGSILRQLSFPIDRATSFDPIMERVHHFERKIVRDYLFDLESQEGSR